MIKVLLIGAGGFIGAILRYGVSGLVQEISGSVGFPAGTLVVNVLGCLLIGLLSKIAEDWGVFSVELRLFLMIGFRYSQIKDTTLTLIILSPGDDFASSPFL